MIFPRICCILLTALAPVACADRFFDFSGSATISLQCVGESSPVILAQIRYDPSSLAAELDSYEAPDIAPDVRFVKLGIYDVLSKSWETSTTVTTVETFAQAYLPIFILSLDANGDVLSVAVRSGTADAGQTRDFGPKVKVVRMSQGAQPELNRPVVLSPEGKIEVEEPEKTLLQRYWWVGLGILMLLITTGGDK